MDKFVLLKLCYLIFAFFRTALHETLRVYSTLLDLLLDFFSRTRLVIALFPQRVVAIASTVAPGAAPGECCILFIDVLVESLQYPIILDCFRITQ